MENKKVSIVLPCYNVEEYLTKCLDSIINQTYKNIEIICVNDGSTDNTLKILNSYKVLDDRFIVVNQENAGVSSARTNALNYVTGDYIMFVDSDDWIDVRTCELAVKKALQYDCDMVIWNYIREFPNNPLPKRILGEQEIYFDEESVKHRLMRRTIGLYREELFHPENAESLVTIWGKLYRSSIIINNNLQFVDLKKIGSLEDALFNLDVYKYVKSAIYIPDFLYHYRKNNKSSVTSSYKEKLYGQWNNLFDIMNNYITSNNLDSEYSEALDNRITLSIILLGLNILESGKEINKVEKIKKIISSPRYRNSCKQLKFKYLPIHWKVFFAFAKYNCSIGVFLMLKAIKALIGK